MSTATSPTVRADRTVTIRIPALLHEELERRARELRKETGENWSFSRLVRHLLADGVGFEGLEE